MFFFRYKDKESKRNVSDYNSDEIFWGGARSNFGSGSDDAEEENSDESDGDGDGNNDTQDKLTFNNPRCQRGGGIDKEESARLGAQLNQDLKNTMRRYLGIDNEKKEKHSRRMERKEDDVDSRPSSYLHPLMKTEKEREKDRYEKKEVNKEILEERDRKRKERKNGIYEIECKSPFGVGGDKEKEKVVDMDIETDDDDDDGDTNGARNKPILFKGTTTTTTTTPPPTAPPTAHIIPGRYGGFLKKLPTPPSSESQSASAPTTPSDSPLTDDGLISTEIIKPQVTYRIQGDSFIPRKFNNNEDTEKEKEEGDVNMEDDI